MLLAIEAGDVAAAATRRIASGNSDPTDVGTGLRGLFERWSRRSGGPAVTQTQVDRTCENLDDFATTIDDVNAHVATQQERIDTPDDWRSRLQDSTRAAADIHNEVTATLAILGRYRTNIVLGRPLVDGVDEASPAGTKSSHDESVMPPRLTWTTVCIDSSDADRLAEFYCRLLGWEVTARDERGWAQARDPNGGVGLNFQSEPNYLPPVWPEEPAEQAKMLHFEIMVDDLEQGVTHAIESGAAQAPWQPPDRDPARIRVMLDPAGHPFCLFTAGE